MTLVITSWKKLAICKAERATVQSVEDLINFLSANEDKQEETE